MCFFPSSSREIPSDGTFLDKSRQAFWGPPSFDEFHRKMSALCVTDVPGEIPANKADGGGTNPLPQLRVSVGSNLHGAQARSGLPDRDVSLVFVQIPPRVREAPPLQQPQR